MKKLYSILKQVLSSLIEPRSTSEDARRQEFVLNALLLGTLPLTLIALIQVSVGSILRGSEFRGAPPLAVGVIVLIIIGLYALSRTGRHRIAAYLFIASFTALGAANAYAWGISLPTGPLVFVLVIIISGSLIGTRFSLLMTGIISLIVVTLGYLESHHITRPDLSWTGEPVNLADAFAYVFIWSIIALVSSLSNHEIGHSLRRARASEADLAKQRDLLEIRVEERTRELKQAQLEKLLQLNRFADFGRISSGFFHDIINPLTAVSLNLEQLSTKRRSELLQQAIKGIKHIEDFAQAARKQVQNRGNDLRVFPPAKEIREVVEVLESKARGAGVSIHCELDEHLLLHGSPTKFHQLVSNLIANAIDACEGIDLARRIVSITTARHGNLFRLTIKDHGVGIPADQLKHIFDPFFTTKPIDKGTGIGLLIVKQIVEEGFHGSIRVKSKPSGTAFTVLLPVITP